MQEVNVEWWASAHEDRYLLALSRLLNIKPECLLAILLKARAERLAGYPVDIEWELGKRYDVTASLAEGVRDIVAYSEDACWDLLQEAVDEAIGIYESC